MAISDSEKRRLNVSMPVADDVKLGDIIQSLQTSVGGKLTANKAATQANSTATDVAGLVTDFNALLAKLKAAGLM